jgi:hypothetical protein
MAEIQPWPPRSPRGDGRPGPALEESAPTVARRFGHWGFLCVYGGQRTNDRASGDAGAHMTVNSTVNAPDVPIDTDGWGVCRLAKRGRPRSVLDRASVPDRA